ncbi:MAG: FKBP-type peptidyl-prolyl cis-trans isomerase [Acidobacteria bacterium]|nr:FKBP-type peptidyl-prolyl cis-trans isomerase [Acidobacteriota bacterium]MBV9475003.1 FKBP-type peptidyl-prolyl cis-trans isomerase [Acidobacteriota bacterium]
MKRLLPILLVALSLAAADKPAPPADLTAPPADAEKAADGLVTKRLAPGTGTEKPAADDLVRVRYTVWKSDGSLVQNVVEPQSLLIGVPKMIPGWGEAVRGMVVGERQRAWVPGALTGGKVDNGLVFDTELVEIVHPPQTPADVAAPSEGAIKTPSGLAYKVLRPGDGTQHPKRKDTVVVHYTGWTTDGRMFDSSVVRGEPATFPLGGVIKGWIEGLQLMTPGEQARLWIPGNLAYGNEPGKPHGTLVFDIELIAIK